MDDNTSISEVEEHDSDTISVEETDATDIESFDDDDDDDDEDDDEDDDTDSSSDDNNDSPPQETFVLNPADAPYQNLLAARNDGSEKFNMMLSAMAMVFGKGAEVIKAGFDRTEASEKARGAISAFEKDKVAGWTATNSLIKMLREANDIAETVKGSVSFNLIFEPGKPADGDTPATQDSVTLKPLWRGINGVTTTRRGGRRGRYQYFDGGTLIETSLKKYLVEKYPTSNASKLIADYEEKENSNISAWAAAERGMKDGDSFVITRKKRDAS